MENRESDDEWAELGRRRGDRPTIDDEELVLAVELEASHRDPYRQLSRLFHLIARRQ